MHTARLRPCCWPCEPAVDSRWSAFSDRHPACKRLHASRWCKVSNTRLQPGNTETICYRTHELPRCLGATCCCPLGLWPCQTRSGSSYKARLAFGDRKWRCTSVRQASMFRCVMFQPGSFLYSLRHVWAAMKKLCWAYGSLNVATVVTHAPIMMPVLSLTQNAMVHSLPFKQMVFHCCFPQFLPIVYLNNHCCPNSIIPDWVLFWATVSRHEATPALKQIIRRFQALEQQAPAYMLPAGASEENRPGVPANPCQAGPSPRHLHGCRFCRTPA